MCDFTGNEKETQTCELKFGSWVYNANQLDLITVSRVKLYINICIKTYTGSNANLFAYFLFLNLPISRRSAPWTWRAIPPAKCGILSLPGWIGG